MGNNDYSGLRENTAKPQVNRHIPIIHKIIFTKFQRIVANLLLINLILRTIIWRYFGSTRVLIRAVNKVRRMQIIEFEVAK
jgi:hypothetical protein